MENISKRYDLVSLGLNEYAENELVFEIIQNLMELFEKKDCNCRQGSKNKKDKRTCYEKVGFKKFFERHIEIRSLEKSQFEIFLKAQLMSFEITNEKTENPSRVTYKYNFNNSLPLCKPTFLKLIGKTDYYLSTLQKYLQDNGLVERTHGNTGRAPILLSRAYINLDVSSSVKNFLIQYSNIHGLPSPLRHRNDSGVFIYLPTENTYVSIYEKYIKNVKHDQSQIIISYNIFIKLWHELASQIKFQTSASDLCETCEILKAELKIVKHDIDEYNKIKNQYELHIKAANLEREHYNKTINESKNNKSIAHICYDWAQNVSVPYSPQQVGTIYFKNTFSVHLFGVCKTEGGQNYQLNFLIAEDEFPKGTAKGANTTLNMVYSALQKFARIGKKHLRITCDNCSGQNKNNLSLWFWIWLVMLGWYKDIIINFMISGHMKFICDSFFGHIKKVYRDTRINTINDIERVVNCSSKGNEAICYKNG